MDKLVKQLKDVANKALAALLSSAKSAASEAKRAAADVKVAAAASPHAGPVSKDPKGTAGGSRPMKFPYTFTGKVVQFPWVYYVKNNWVFKYYAVAIILCLPIFKKISGVFNSPTNVAKWEEIKRKEREEEEHHH